MSYLSKTPLKTLLDLLKGYIDKKGGDTFDDLKVTAQVDNTTGTPSVIVTKSGNGSKKIDFSFFGLKGEQGPQGDIGPQGPQGPKGDNASLPEGEDGQILSLVDGNIGWVNRWRTLSKYEFVDLGLSVLWATCNIGANSPEEYGWYFQFGGTTPYNSDRTPVEGGDAIEFGWNSDCPFWVEDEYYDAKWSKYTGSDDKWDLEPEDDAAHVHLGGDWRMPYSTEFTELINACNTTWVTNYKGSGINGRLLTLKSDPSKTLFFPAAGYLDEENLGPVREGVYGIYWSNSLSSYPYQGRGLQLDESSFIRSDTYRYYGQPVRAVKPKS